MTSEELRPAAYSTAQGRIRLGRHQIKALAWTVSALFHFIALVAIFGSTSGALMAADPGGAEVQGMTVLLVKAPEPSTGVADPGGDLRPLLAKLGSDEKPVEMETPRTASDMTRLLQRLQTSAPPLEQRRDPQPSATTQIAEAAKDPRRASDQGMTGQADGADAARAGSPGGLWGEIEPCWQALGRRSTVPVTLEVVLDFRGRLSTPPQIVRSAGAVIDEPRLRAEARALSALEACLPKGDPRFGGRTYRLDFKPTR